MRTEQLLGIYHVKDGHLAHDELTLHSTFMDKQLPKTGLTLARNMDAFNSVLKLIQNTKTPAKSTAQIVSVLFSGNRHSLQTDTRVSWSSVKNADYLKLKELDKEVNEPIHDVVWNWVEEQSSKGTNLSKALMDKGFYKQTTEGIKPKLTSTRQVIAEYPEVVDLIHQLPEFQHIDAIAYSIKVNGQMEEFITIFKDTALFLDDFSTDQKHINASMSNFKGYLTLPKCVAKSGSLVTVSQAKEQHRQLQQQMAVNVA